MCYRTQSGCCITNYPYFIRYLHSGDLDTLRELVQVSLLENPLYEKGEFFVHFNHKLQRDDYYQVLFIDRRKRQ